MTKLTIAIAIVMAVVLLAMPPALGTFTEAKVRERVAAIEASGILSAEVKSFDRGWFGSTAKIELGVAPSYLGQLSGFGAISSDPTQLVRRATIVVDFAHGPVAVLDGVHLGWSKMVAHLDPQMPGIAAFEQQLGVPYLFEFRGRTNFAGTLAFDADVPPIDLPVGDTELKFSGAFLEGTLAADQLVTAARVDSVEFTSPTGTFALRKLRSQGDNHLRSLYVRPGRAEFSIERIELVDGLRQAMPVFEVDNFKGTSLVTLDGAGALLDMQMTYGLDRMRIEDSVIAAATLGVGLHHLDIAAIEAYSTAMRELTATSTAADPSVMLATLAPQIGRALAAGPSVVFDPVRFNVDGEPLEGRIEVLANKDRLPQAGLLDLDNPLLVLGLLDSNAELRVSKALGHRLASLAAQMQLGGNGSIPPDQLEFMAEAQAGLLLVMLVGQGVLIEENDGYRTTIQFANGALTLNGNPLPFGLP